MTTTPVRPLAPTADADTEAGGVQSAIAWSSFLFALLQSICTFFAAANGLRFAVGLGSLVLSVGAGTMVDRFHADAIRIPMIVVALIGSLLTAIPLSPAGLGFAQAGVIGVLTVAYGIPLPEATAITILDWVISVLSIIVFGAIVYVVSPMPRGMGHISQPPAATSAASTA